MQKVEFVLMKVGKTANNYCIPEDVIIAALDKFKGVPIKLNKNQQFKNYNDKDGYVQLPVVGHVTQDTAKLVDGKVICNVEIEDEYASNGKMDNFLINTKFKENSTELASIDEIISFEMF